MLSILLGLIPGLLSTVNGITNAITNEKINLAQSQTESDRIASQKRLLSLQAKRDVLIAESGSSKINAFIRASIGGSVRFCFWARSLSGIKHLGITPEDILIVFDPNLWNVIMATIVFILFMRVQLTLQGFGNLDI